MTNSQDSLLDKIVFKKLVLALGGSCQLGVCGAAPMKNEVMNSVRAALGFYVSEGYGQTECCAGACMNTLNDPNSSVGPPMPCNAVKLVDVPEMNYFSNKDQGEICIKGPNVMREYYKNKNDTAETLDQDGWLHTGDIGEWTQFGTLRIIDRKKNIFKTSLGEYIAPEKIENIYIMHDAVAQCFVYGDGLKSQLVGIVFVDEALTDRKTINEKDLLKELQNLGKKNGLHSFENIKCLKIETNLMTVENDMLTPTMKAKRKVIEKAYRAELDDLYVELEGGVKLDDVEVEVDQDKPKRKIFGCFC